MRRARHAAAISRSFPLGPAIVTRKAPLVLITSTPPVRGTLGATAYPRGLRPWAVAAKLKLVAATRRDSRSSCVGASSVFRVL